MPTINELPPATSVSDGDEIMVSQSDIARSATRAQLLAGVQSALALPPNSLLGRVSDGIGAPETIAVGANLTIGNGTINAPAAFEISSLPPAGPPQANDLVAVAQGGQNTAANFAAFMGGLGSLSGISGSNLLVAPTGGVGVRRLADVMGDSISIESFGALGDGSTDDTNAFAAALQSGRTIRLDGRTYVVNGPLSAQNICTLLGVPGVTIIRRLQLAGQNQWIEFGGSITFVYGVTFDANNLAAANSPAVQVTAYCLSATFENCQFLNAFGTSGGDGLLITCAVGACHAVLACSANNNGMNGVAIVGPGKAFIANNVLRGNGASGIAVASETGCLVRGNDCAFNTIGISVGAWTAASSPPMSTVECMVESNSCFNNSYWGLAVGGYMAAIRNNIVSSTGLNSAGGGIITRLGSSCVTGNQVIGCTIGIDARSSQNSSFALNSINNNTTGLASGGCQSVTIYGNFFTGNQWGIDVTAVEPTLSNALTGPISISANWIGFSGPQGGGIFVHDGALGVSINNNDINGWGSATINQALWLHTDRAIVNGNRWNNEPQFLVQGGSISGFSALVVPDIADSVLVLSAGNPVVSLLTAHQADTLGQICFVKVIAGGSGYSSAQIAISGSGQGATAEAIISDGALLWIVIVNPGSGYGPIGTGAAVAITGDGVGASATAYVGLPVVTGRRLRLHCNCSVQFSLSGASPPQANWTNFIATVPAIGLIEMEGAFGGWRAVSFPATDYIMPTGDGGAVIQSAAGGDIILRPSVGGVLQIASAAEPTGCTSTVGRGAPTGAVAAPPGSDFRNLNGGPGNTLWIKQTGTDANGWAAIA
jgi:hypothetical protein